MKIGINLLLWTAHPTNEHFHLFDKFKAVGFDGVEVPLNDGDPAHHATVGKALKDAGLESHATLIIPDEAHNPISPDAAVRAKAMDHIKWGIDCAAALDAGHICGPMHSPLGVFTGGGPTDDEKKWCADVHREAGDIAKEANVKLTVEYLNRFESYFLTTMADTAEHIKRVNHPNVVAMFDTFHANIEEKDPPQAFRDHADTIEYIHISENDRGTPGKGHIEWAKLFKAFRDTGYDNWLTIEAFGRALPEVAAATRIWRDLFPSPVEVYTEGCKFIKQQWEQAG